MLGYERKKEIEGSFVYFNFENELLQKMPPRQYRRF
jgi:hypothetical protein